jgi:glycosyltransferase involved in cell wall biosynthesis
LAFDGIAPAFVWSHHELFQTTGVSLARRLSVPLVQFVDAPQVWEARRWGVRRLGWGGVLERVGERPQLRAADVVACVSDEVAAVVVEMGVPRQQIVVTPVGVDLQRFGPHASRQNMRRRLGLQNRFVIGWVGSFRPFHSLHLALEATKRLQESVPEAALLLVGDGQERRRTQALADEMRVHAVFTGTIPYEQVAGHVAAMDVAVILGAGGQAFHYSPLKLREYMASARPVVAMRAGEVGRILRDGVDGLLVQPGDASALARAIRLLYDRPDLRHRIGAAARERAVAEWSWDAQLRRVTEVLESAAKAAM